MSNIKKIIGVVLALVMVLSMASVAFAADGDKYSVAVSVDKTTIAPGESATVTVKLTANFYVSAFSIPVFYDKTQVTVDAGTPGFDAVTIADENSEDIAKVFESGEVANDGNTGVRVATYLPAYMDTLSTYNDTTVMTFTVTAKDGATGSVDLKCLEKSLKTNANSAGQLYVVKNSSGTNKLDSLAEVIDAADITGALTTTINFASAMQEADLAVKSAYASSGIVIDSNKTFGGKYDGVVYGFALDATLNAAFYTARLEATNGGSIAIVKTPYVARPASYGTGATVQVKNSDGSLAKTYVIVIFGDVNGDGKILSNDALAVYNHANGITLIEGDEIKIMAANAVTATGRNDTQKATSLHTVNSLDALEVYNASSGTALDQAALASSHVLYNVYYQ